MLFLSALCTVAATAGFALVSAQEAGRFGTVTVSPSGDSLAPNEVITVTYNSSFATQQPLFVDFYLEGTFSDGNAAPNLLISRNTYGAHQTLLVQNETLPNFGFLGDVHYTLWAFVAYNQDGLTEIRGVQAP
ncbi:hypothetical protein GYMLUDRAFT_58316 [Collybiopsis luxurians FD-317 M1]|uniref:Signal sequence receptor subunit alpha n=1 Tax=Collybiopsis luxurians FD-317 M1 TaxID=944289 RepID=A0A0D0CIT0_9AGAR|nr:hypothetical protein GYMLUDRAFT_58316 [Collybiopsis luxurians FD-317 M1]